MALDRRRMMGNYLPLRDAIDRLFEGSVISPQMVGGQAGFPAANVHVTDDDVIVEMAVPGVNPEDINISVSGDTVTVSGEARRERHDKDKKGQTYVEEIWEGSFQRSFVLPFPVDADKANATFENGMLKLTLPKSEAAKPRKIQLTQQRGRQGQQQGQAQQQGQGQQSQQPQAQSETHGEVQKERVYAGSGQKA
jgi:HSP20 family protein